MEMESKKNVIEIVKKPSNQFEYEEHYYFTGVNLEFNVTDIGMTGDVWEATKFKDMTSNEAAAWCNFLKAILGKRYEINIKTISLTYNI
jgi:hypothetical protein